MDLFQSGYDPSEWELVDNRSDGEYLSLTEDSDSFSKDNHYNQDSDAESELSQIDETLHFLDIKMMSPYIDLPALLKQRSDLQAKLSVLTPGQFHLSRRYAYQISQLSTQIDKIQQPSVVNIHNYTPTDADFIPAQRKESREKSIVKFSEPIQETLLEDETLDNTIFHLEESIREKEALVVDLWKSLKLQKEELNFLKMKRDEQIEREMFNEDT